MNEKDITEKESLALIAQMINKAKESYRDTGVEFYYVGNHHHYLFAAKIVRDTF